MTLSENAKTSPVLPWAQIRTLKIFKMGAIALSLLGAMTLGQSTAYATDTLSRLINAKPGSKTVRLSPVREATLRASARTLGTQSGLIERAKEIQEEVNKRRIPMEKAFRFGDLVIGAGVLPPVLLHTENAATVTQDTMRLAGAVYEIKQPARFFSGAPSWRDWLLLGLPSTSDMPEVPDNEQLRPRDGDEQTFWEQEIRQAYISGRAQAQEVFEHNLSTLEQVYIGMRTFYDLYQRNMVSAPIIAKSQEVLTVEDENTIVVGDTLFRITMPAQFMKNPEQWKALQARPSANKALPVAPGFDPEQVKEAFEVYKVQQMQRQAEIDANGGKKPVVSLATSGSGSITKVKTPAKPKAKTKAPAKPKFVTPVPVAPKPVVAAPKPPEVSINKPLFAVPSR